MMRQPLPFLFACLLSLALTGCLGKAAPDTLYALEPLTGTDTAPGAKLSSMRSEGTRLNSSHCSISYAVFCLKKKKVKAPLALRY